MVATHARLRPHKIGARDSQRALTFRQWDKRASRLANALLGLGLSKGDRVALLAYNCVEWMELYVALARTGLIAVPVNFRLTGPEIAYIVRDCEAAAFVVQDGLVEPVLAVRDDLDQPERCLFEVGLRPAGRCFLGQVSGGVRRAEHHETASGWTSSSRLVASIPSTPGMLMSMSTSAGRSPAASLTASSPPAASPTSWN
jgi:acyl-CoA synthetase (AMP-forming)/AMP-acid ligase II